MSIVLKLGLLMSDAIHTDTIDSKCRASLEKNCRLCHFDTFLGDLLNPVAFPTMLTTDCRSRSILEYIRLLVNSFDTYGVTIRYSRPLRSNSSKKAVVNTPA